MTKIGKIYLIITMFVAIAFSAQAVEAGGTVRWGLFIGANNGGRGLDQLLYADDDAASFAETLTELGGLSPSNVEILIDPQPIEILEALDRIARDMESYEITVKQEFVFYYSGHSDDQGLILDNTSLSYSQLKAHLNEMDSDVTLAILDSCSSGAFTRAKGGVHRAPFMLDDSVSTEGHAYLTSSSASEISQESDLIGGSFFTYFLVAGLRGAADNNGDGRVTLNEVYQHTYNETINRTLETGGVQHPTYEINLSGSGDLVMTDLNQPTSVLMLDQTLEGQLFIKNSEGMLVLEMTKPLGQVFPLALPAGEYIVQVIHSTGVNKSAPVVLLENQTVTIGPMDLTPVGLEATRSRGDEQENEEISDDDMIKIQTDEGTIIITRDGITIVDHEDGEQISISEDFLGEDFLEDLDFDEKDEADEDGYDYEPLYLRNERMQEERAIVPFSLTFVPGISTVNVLDKEVNCEIGFLCKAAAVDGVQAGYIGATTVDYSNAVQVAGIYTIAHRSLSGAQFSGIYSQVSGEMEGLQAAGVVGIIGDDTNGAQLNGVAGVIRGELDGVQANGIASIVSGDVNGIQLAGVVNTAGAMSGIQVAGVTNIVRGDFDGIQAAGILNVVTGDASGIQMGLINIGNSLDGVPVGLLNLYREGITTIGGWSEIDGGDDFYYSMMTGNDWVYTHFFTGGSSYDFWQDMENASIGYGLGVRIPVLMGLKLDVDLNYKHKYWLDYSSLENLHNNTTSDPVEGYNHDYDYGNTFWEDNWGENITLLGRAVLTTDWGIQPYIGYTAELMKAEALAGEPMHYIFEDPDMQGYGLSFKMIAGLRFDFF